MTMIALCNAQDSYGVPRATPDTPVMNFLSGPGKDLARHVLSFVCGVKVGRGDLRKLSAAKLLKVGLEVGALNIDRNMWNKKFWGITVDKRGEEIDINDAIRDGILAEEYSEDWGVTVHGKTGDVIDTNGRYGDAGEVLGRINVRPRTIFRP